MNVVILFLLFPHNTDTMTNPQLTIRKVKEQDLNDIVKVLSHYNFKIISAVDNFPIDDSSVDKITLHNNISGLDLNTAFVAIWDRRIVGFSHYKHVKEDLATTTLMTVLPNYRRLGIGQELQLARMKEAYDRGYKRLITYCETPSTVDWYIKNFKYKKIGTEPNRPRLHFFKLKNKVIWGIHFGYREFKDDKVLVCDLITFFQIKNR